MPISRSLQSASGVKDTSNDAWLTALTSSAKFAALKYNSEEAIQIGVLASEASALDITTPGTLNFLQHTHPRKTTIVSNTVQTATDTAKLIFPTPTSGESNASASETQLQLPLMTFAGAASAFSESRAADIGATTPIRCTLYASVDKLIELLVGSKTSASLSVRLDVAIGRFQCWHDHVGSA